MKVQVEDLRSLFLVIERAVSDRNIPEKQKPRWIRILQIVAKTSFDLGRNGKAEIEI